MCSAALAEVSMVARSTSVETAPSCMVVEVVLLVDGGSTKQTSRPYEPGWWLT